MIDIRPERHTDHAAVGRIVTEAFGRADEARIVEKIRSSPAAVLSLIATRDGEPAAYVLFSVVDPDTPGQRACALGPVAVQPEHQRTGIGSQLIRHGIEKIRAQAYPMLFVLGDPKYYSRFGFELAGPHGWHFASHEFDRAFQLIRFAGTSAHTGEAHTGEAHTGERWVKYDAAFS